jgi:FKBP-type peptidyl-prolyl cis-trans isomerase (trigger factor)
MFKRNPDIRTAKGKIPNWVIAERLGIHENTMYSWMRKQLNDSEKQLILEAIRKIKLEIETGGEKNDKNNFVDN